MIKLSVKLNIEEMKRTVALSQREVNKAASRAINRAIDASATTAKREVSKATRIKVNDVRRHMSVSGATPDRLIAELSVYPYAPNLAKFNAKPNKAGVAATAWEGRKTYKHAFINPRTGKVVARVGKERVPLKGLFGPSVPNTFMREQILKAIEDSALARFTSEFNREVTRRLG